MIALISCFLYLLILGITKESFRGRISSDELIVFAIFWPITLPYSLGIAMVKSISSISIKKTFTKKGNDNVQEK